jgi:CO/xanthine dehydrogenase Mo-binding subunit
VTVGAPVRRREGPRFLAGRGHYVGDVELPRLLHVAFVRSAHAHARLREIDAVAAAGHAGRAAPGPQPHPLAAHAPLDDPLSREQDRRRSRIRGRRSRLQGGSGAGGSTTLESFRGSWMLAAWGRMRRTGVNVSYGQAN